jgi:hypothetical protein
MRMGEVAKERLHQRDRGRLPVAPEPMRCAKCGGVVLNIPEYLRGVVTPQCRECAVAVEEPARGSRPGR